MSVEKHTIWALTVGICLSASSAAQTARACGGAWYPEVTVDPRILGVARAEGALRDGKHLAAAASVLRMMPHIKMLKPKPGSLVGRAERVLAVALSRAQGALPVHREVPESVLGAWAGAGQGEAAANLEWSIDVLRRQSATKPDDPSLETDLGEALARVDAHREEARALLEGLARRDLISSAEGYAALALLRSLGGDTEGQKLALKRCEAMAGDHGACVLRS